MGSLLGFSDDEELAAAAGMAAFGDIFGGLKGEMMGAGKSSSARGKSTSTAPSLPNPVPAAETTETTAAPENADKDLVSNDPQINATVDEMANLDSKSMAETAGTGVGSRANAAPSPDTQASRIGNVDAIGSGAGPASAPGESTAAGPGGMGGHSGIGGSQNEGKDSSVGGYHDGGIVTRTGLANVLKGEGVLTRATVKGIGAERVRRLNQIFASGMSPAKKMAMARELFGAPLALIYPRAVA